MVTLLVDGNNHFLRVFFTKAILEQDLLNIDLWRYISFDIIMRYIWKFNAKEVIIAKDGYDYWRKKVYKQYKSNRNKARETSKFNWNEIFSEYNKWLEEIKTHIPFKVISLKYCEADDIIAVLCRRSGEKIILSTDTDYSQLISENVNVYDPYKNEFMKRDPDLTLIAALNGSKKNNIQNILTPLDWDGVSKVPRFGINKAKKILESGLDEWLNKDEELKKRFQILLRLVDFNYIPDYLVDKINESYDNYKLPDFAKISEFLLKCNWESYKDKISEIENKLMELS